MSDIKKKSCLTAILVVFAIALLAAPVAVNAKTLKIGHILAPNSNQNQALEKVFKPYVEEK
ncbi:MAG: hypothetical protein ACLFUP_04595, partial [Desulfobacteraceae bacterium]